MAKKVTPAALDEKDAGIYIGMSVSFLRKSRMEGDRKRRTPGPPYVRVGRTIRYLIRDLDAWLDQHRVRGNPEQDTRWGGLRR